MIELEAYMDHKTLRPMCSAWETPNKISSFVSINNQCRTIEDAAERTEEEIKEEILKRITRMDFSWLLKKTKREPSLLWEMPVVPFS